MRVAIKKKITYILDSHDGRDTSDVVRSLSVLVGRGAPPLLTRADTDNIGRRGRIRSENSLEGSDRCDAVRAP